jgi:hypothetical protein
MKDIEIWISPELADTVSNGDVMTIVVSDMKKMGSGFLVSGKGAVVNTRDSKSVSEQLNSDIIEEDRTTEGEVSSFDLSGSASFPENVSSETDEHTESNTADLGAVDDDSHTIVDSDDSPSGISFGERGPQLINGEETPEDTADKDDIDSPKEVATPRGRKTVGSMSELYDELSKRADVESEIEMDLSNVSPDMRREMAVKLEKEGKIGCGVDAWVKNKSGGQLHLSDIDVTIRHGDSFNLGRVSPHRIMASTDLFESVSSGLLEFISADAAIKMNIATERRLADLEERIGGIDVYDNSDDVYDAINDSDFDDSFDDDPFPRMDAKANVRKAVNVDDRFRRGIRQAGKRSGADRAAVEAPGRFRDMEPQNVLADDKYEFDEIFDGIESRESQISESSDIDWVGEEGETAVNKSSRSHVSVKRK